RRRTSTSRAGWCPCSSSAAAPSPSTSPISRPSRGWPSSRGASTCCRTARWKSSAFRGNPPSRTDPMCYAPRRMKTRHLVWLLLPAVAVALPGCAMTKKILGIRDPGEPSVVIKSAETRWLLIKNPRFGDVASEPEYVWVEEDKVPTTITTLLRGQSAIIAQPEIVAKYGSPPGGGKISPRQGTMYQTAEPAKPAAGKRSGGAAVTAPSPQSSAARATASAVPTPVPAPVAKPPERGYIVYVENTRVVID